LFCYFPFCRFKGEIYHQDSRPPIHFRS
jgi:hypothetical protein